MDDNTRLEDLEQLYQAAKAWRRNLSDILGPVKLSDGVESLMARSEHAVSTFEVLRDTIDRLMEKEVDGDKVENEKSQRGGMGFAMKTSFGKLGLGKQRPISELVNEAPLAIVIDPKREYRAKGLG